MQSPDFARFDTQSLAPADLVFLFERFPAPNVDAVEAARRVIEQPSTLESLLESRFVVKAVLEPDSASLSVSPRLFFNVLLRHCLPGRREAAEREALNYLANVLALFVRTDRLYRVQAGDGQAHEYLVDLVAEAANAKPERQFLVCTHIGNYAMFLSGICAPWIEHRRRYRRRPLSLDYYRGMGRSYYASAARHPRAQDLHLRGVFGQLSQRFDYYRSGLERLSQRAWAA